MRCQGVFHSTANGTNRNTRIQRACLLAQSLKYPRTKRGACNGFDHLTAEGFDEHFAGVDVLDAARFEVEYGFLIKLTRRRAV